MATAPSTTASHTDLVNGESSCLEILQLPSPWGEMLDRIRSQVVCEHFQTLSIGPIKVQKVEIIISRGIYLFILIFHSPKERVVPFLNVFRFPL